MLEKQTDQKKEKIKTWYSNKEIGFYKVHLQSWCQFWRCKWSGGQLSRCCDVEASVVVSSNSNNGTTAAQRWRCRVSTSVMGCNTNMRREVAWCHQFSPAHFHQRGTRGVRVSTFLFGMIWNHFDFDIHLDVDLAKNSVYATTQGSKRQKWIKWFGTRISFSLHYQCPVLVLVTKWCSLPALLPGSLRCLSVSDKRVDCNADHSPPRICPMTRSEVWPGTPDWQRNFVLIKEVATKPTFVRSPGAMKDIHCIAELSE